MNKNKPLRIALVGNMNNNNFSIMRYLCDLGIDAHLILNYTDGKGESVHFTPNSDTWEIDKWIKNIHYSNLNEDPISVFKFPIALFFTFKSILNKIFIKKNVVIFPVSKKVINELFNNYTHIIGSGISPAILNRINKKIDIYYPYAIGVEWFMDPVFQNKKHSKNPITRIFFQLILNKQISGIKNSNIVICADKSITFQSLYSIGKTPILSFCPMVYNRELFPIHIDNKEIDYLLEIIQKSEISILSHVRHKWVKPDYINLEEWKYQNKNNDWLIRAFKKLLENSIVTNPILILFEYGDDYKETKALCESLEISKYVYWTKKKHRKEILYLLSKIDIGVGEFYELPKMLFGGTGYEILASGTPLIQGFNYNENEFEETFNIPLPPLLQVKNSADVYKHLVDLAKNKNNREEIGKKSKIWFDSNCGIGLAEKWLKLLSN